MHAKRLAARLKQEFQARRQKNTRYSLRAFAAFLEIDHSTLSQIMRGRRRAPASQIRGWGRKLGMDREEIAAYIAAEHVPDAATIERQQQLLHWSAEALSIANDHAHWEILRLCGTQEFRADSRWIADRIGAPVDEVNVALSRLLRLRLLGMSSTGRWTDLTRLAAGGEAEFRKLALARVRERAKS